MGSKFRGEPHALVEWRLHNNHSVKTCKMCGSWAAISDSYGSSLVHRIYMLHAYTCVYTLLRGVCCSVCLIPHTSFTGTFQLLLQLVDCVLHGALSVLADFLGEDECTHAWLLVGIRGMWQCVIDYILNLRAFFQCT